MAYEMNAEGTNGVQQTTYLINNTGGGGWIFLLHCPMALSLHRTTVPSFCLSRRCRGNPIPTWPLFNALAQAKAQG